MPTQDVPQTGNKLLQTPLQVTQLLPCPAVYLPDKSLDPHLPELDRLRHEQTIMGGDMGQQAGRQGLFEQDNTFPQLFLDIVVPIELLYLPERTCILFPNSEQTTINYLLLNSIERGHGCLLRQALNYQITIPTCHHTDSSYMWGHSWTSLSYPHLTPETHPLPQGQCVLTCPPTPRCLGLNSRQTTDPGSPPGGQTQTLPPPLPSLNRTDQTRTDRDRDNMEQTVGVPWLGLLGWVYW